MDQKYFHSEVCAFSVCFTTVHVHMRFDIPQAGLCVCVCVVCVYTVHAVYVIMSNCSSVKK